MTFAVDDYLSWYVPRIMRGDGAVNLHSSGVPPLDADALELPGGDPWALVPRFEKALGDWLGIDAESIVFTPGATGGTLLALMTLATRESEILVEGPVYEPMLRQARRLGVVRRLPRRRDAAFGLPISEIASMVSDATTVVMLTEPNNPAGRFAPRDEVLALAEAARARGAILLVNEVYLGYTDRPTFFGEADNIVVVSSLSKLMGTYWARLGWLAAPPSLATKLRMAHMNMGMATKPAAAVGLAVLETAAQRCSRANELAQSGLAVVDRWVTANEGLSWKPPEGPGFGAIALPPTVDDVRLAEHLHDEKGVLVVPGTLFEARGTLRVSWIQAGDRLEEGLAAVAEAALDPTLGAATGGS